MSFQNKHLHPTSSPQDPEIVIGELQFDSSSGSSKSPLLLKESKFGAFGKEFDSSNSNGKRNDDFYIMGDEELQIVGGGCCSNEYENDTHDGGNENGCAEESISSVSYPSRQNEINNSITSDGFDVCLEYGYRYEFTEEDDSDEMEDNHLATNDSSGIETKSLMTKLRMLPLGSNTDTSTGTNGNNGNTNASRKRENEISYQTHILGKTYHPINDYHAKRDDESNLFWMTYRCDFIEIKPYAITSDAGWGCMLRSAQMLLAQVLRIHWKGRDWRAERSLKMRRENGFLRDLLTWFADYPSPGTGSHGGQSSFSLHNMVAAGMARYDILPGEWFGPGTACHVLRDLVNLHSRSLQLLHDTNDDSGGVGGAEDAASEKRSHEMKVYVAPEGTIYQSDLRELLIKQKHVKVKNSVDT